MHSIGVTVGVTARGGATASLVGGPATTPALVNCPFRSALLAPRTTLRRTRSLRVQGSGSASGGPPPPAGAAADSSAPRDTQPARAAAAEEAPTHSAAVPGSSSSDPQAAEEAGAWRSKRWLAFGGSVAAVLVLTVFRREIAPALRWIITQINNLTDKSLIGEVGEGKVEAIATLVAVALTLYWSFTEFAASSDRMKSLEGLEEKLEERLAALEGRVESAEGRLDSMAAELAELRLSRWQGQVVNGDGRREARLAGSVAEVAAELAKLRAEQEGARLGLQQQQQR